MDERLTITRTFAAPRELVWRLWTSPEHFSVWFGTDAVTIPLESMTMDVRVGGTWSATMQLPDGSTKDWAGEYREVYAPSHLAFTLTDMPDQDAGEPVTVDLVEVGAGTGMTFTQARHGFTDEQVAQVIGGYTAFFDVMERLADQVAASDD